MKIREKLQHKYALSPKGATDMLKAFVSVTLSDIVLMFPAGMVFILISDLLNDNMNSGRIPFYAIGCGICLLLIAITTYIQYNATFFSTYEESGVRRTTLAERLRKMPLSYFGKKDLADLTGTIMSDCATLETASSHWYPELTGALISTSLVALGLFFFDWRMALAALWVLPIAVIIVLSSSRVQKMIGRRHMELKLACADGIQECLETARDLRANNARDAYMEGLKKKIKAIEKHSIMTEVATAFFVVSAQMILKIGIATVALVGGGLLVKGKLDVLTFFMFLLLVSRLYDPLQVALQNLAAIISTEVQCERMDEILSYEVQTGEESLWNEGCDIVFENVGFTYESTCCAFGR
ncbi:MAG: ABC transporter ATP-binding protein [Lachnospiraceae bacterium]|nr:ABC transporter ATP-binding protein [Lachnospiraceae bacterium]